MKDIFAQTKQNYGKTALYYIVISKKWKIYKTAIVAPFLQGPLMITYILEVLFAFFKLPAALWLWDKCFVLEMEMTLLLSRANLYKLWRD